MDNVSKKIQRLSFATLFLLLVFVGTTNTVHAQYAVDDTIRDWYFSGQGFNFDGYMYASTFGGSHMEYLSGYVDAAGDTLTTEYCYNNFWNYTVDYVCYSSANVCGDYGSGTQQTQAFYNNGAWYSSGSSWGCNAVTPDPLGYGTPPGTGDGGGYDIYAGMSKNIINRDGYYFCATNNSGNNYFVPANTAYELATFINAAPNLGVGIHW